MSVGGQGVVDARRIVAGAEINTEVSSLQEMAYEENRVERSASLRVGQVSAVIKTFQLRRSEISSPEKI
jgi:hypothetical protein